MLRSQLTVMSEWYGEPSNPDVVEPESVRLLKNSYYRGWKYTNTVFLMEKGGLFIVVSSFQGCPD